MSTVERPTPQELFDQERDRVSNTILGGAQVIPESNEWYLASLMYAQAETWYAIADQYRRETDPRTACDDNLVTMAARDGVFPLPAQSAQGFVKIEGTAGQVLPVPLTFTADGQQFTTATDATQPTAIEADGQVAIRVTAVTPGTAGNIAAGTAITLDTMVNTVTAVEVCGAFCNGAEAETTAEFRARYLARLQFQPRATAEFVKTRLANWPCVTRVLDRVGNCCGGTDSVRNILGSSVSSGCGECGCADCGGQLQYYVMFDNTFPNGVAPASVLQEIQTWMFGSPQGYGLGQVEVGVCGRIVEVCPVAVNVVIDLADCPTQSQINTIRDAITDFFTTTEPAINVDTDDIRLTLQRLIGTGIDFAVELNPVNPAQFYGGIYGENSDDKKVFWTPCGLEPDCDVMLTLGSVLITTGTETF